MWELNLTNTSSNLKPVSLAIAKLRKHKVASLCITVWDLKIFQSRLINLNSGFVIKNINILTIG